MRTWGSCRGSKAFACRPGFCVTTDAFRTIIAEAPSIDDRLDRLSRANPTDRESIRTLSAEIRSIVEGIAIPDDLAGAITGALAPLGERAAYAVRSSATAEDLPAASFAGQQDTYLNIVGPAAVLQHVSRCWASLFTDRAVTYRLRNGVDNGKVHMAVVVQQMVFPEAAGVLFTADPVTSNRKVASVEASFGLGEALVSGLVNVDVSRCGTARSSPSPSPPSSSPSHALRLAGRTKGDRAGAPGAAGADGCAGRATRAIGPADRSALRPSPGHRMVPGRRRLPDRPEPADHHPVSLSRLSDGEYHVYISVGHQQMMTDPMKPLGLSHVAADRPPGRCTTAAGGCSSTSP